MIPYSEVAASYVTQTKGSLMRVLWDLTCFLLTTHTFSPGVPVRPGNPSCPPGPGVPGSPGPPGIPEIPEE